MTARLISESNCVNSAETDIRKLLDRKANLQDVHD